MQTLNYSHARQALERQLQEPHLPGLDGIRATAVLLVIFSHLEFPWANGALGVTMFFVLSGFLITWLMLQEQARTGTVSLSGFYRRRIARIFPAFYTFLTLGILIYVARGHDLRPGPILAAAFYYSDYWLAFHPHQSYWLNHTWSLSIEEQFYLCGRWR